MNWNPYFVAYAAAHGRPAGAMGAADDEDWPGGRMVGFQLWMSIRWSEFAALRGYRRTASGHGDTILGPDEHADFAGWLRGFAFAEAEKLQASRSSRDTTRAEDRVDALERARLARTGTRMS